MTKCPGNWREVKETRVRCSPRQFGRKDEERQSRGQSRHSISTCQLIYGPITTFLISRLWSGILSPEQDVFCGQKVMDAKAVVSGQLFIWSRLELYDWCPFVWTGWVDTRRVMTLSYFLMFSQSTAMQNVNLFLFDVYGFTVNSSNMIDVNWSYVPLSLWKSGVLRNKSV